MSAFPAAWGMPVARPGLAGCGAGCSGVGWSPAVGGHIGGDVEGAGGVAEVVVAVGAGPQVGAGVQGGVGPRGVGLESVVAAAQGRDVAGAGGAISAAGVGVVLVAAAGGSGAPGEDAGAVADGDVLLDPVGHGVGV